MISFLVFIIGLILPALSGWLLLRVIEKSQPVLRQGERVALGFLVGCVLTMWATFLLHQAGLPLTWWGYLFVQIIILLVLVWFAKFYGIEPPFFLCKPSKARAAVSWFLGFLVSWFSTKHTNQEAETPDAPLAQQSSRFVRLFIVVLLLWTAAKILVNGGTMLATPVYLDDVFNNWNIRGKIFYEAQSTVLDIEVGTQVGTFSREGVSSYPPMIPMFKAWLASLLGMWSDPLVNAVHIAWYIAILILLYSTLRRTGSHLFAILGVYGLSSLPFYQLHGTNPYVDVFFSGFLLFVVLAFCYAVEASTVSQRRTWFTLAGVAASCLVFIKNEGWVLYQPILFTLFVLSLWCMHRRERLALAYYRSFFVRYLLPVVVVALPWVVYKAAIGLTFGNAKGITDLPIGFHPEALRPLWLATFMLGTWSLLPGVFVGITLLSLRRVFTSVLIIPVVYVLLTYGLQSGIFLFTDLYKELINQTGFSRGLIHIMPVALYATVILLRDLLVERRN